MADEILIKYQVEVDGLKAELKSVEKSMLSVEQTAVAGTKKIEKGFDGVASKTESIRSQLIKLKQQLAQATDPKETERLARAVGKLRDQIEDAGDAAKVFASESKFEQIGNAIGSIGSKLRNLDFKGAADQSKLLVSASKSLTFSEGIAGVKDLGTTLLNFGKSLLMNPIFLIGTAITLIITNFDKLKQSGGIVGETFKFIGNTISGLIQGITDFTDVIGLTDSKLAALAVSQQEAYKTLTKDTQSFFDYKMRLAKAEGKEVDELEKAKILSNNRTLQKELANIIQKQRADKGGTDEQLKRIAEIQEIQLEGSIRLQEIDREQARKRANQANENENIVNDAKKGPRKKDLGDYQKHLSELAEIDRRLRDLRIANILDEDERKRAVIIATFEDEKNKAGTNSEILVELEKKKHRDLLQVTIDSNLKKQQEQDKLVAAQIASDKGRIDAAIAAEKEIDDDLAAIQQAGFDRAISLMEKEVQAKKQQAERIKAIQQGLFQFASQLADSLNEIEQNKIQSQLNASSEARDSEIAIYQNELDAKLITKSQFDQKTKTANEKFRAEESRLKKRAFESQKQAAKVQTIINTAQAVMGALAQFGSIGYAAIVLAALATATGIIQLNVINSQPTPKFAKGGKVGGKLHADGGTLIEAERDEWIIKRSESKKQDRLLHAINNGQTRKYINEIYIAPALREQKRNYEKNKSNDFATNIANSMMLGGSSFKDGNILEALKMSRKNDKEIAQFLVKELKSNSRNSRNW